MQNTIHNLDTKMFENETGEFPAIVMGLNILDPNDAEAFLDGVVVNVLNPKTALFFLAFLPQFVDVSRGSAGAQTLVLGVIFVLLGIVTDGSYALTAGTAAHWLRGHPTFLRREPWISGSMYIGLGVAAALSSGNRK